MTGKVKSVGGALAGNTLPSILVDALAGPNEVLGKRLQLLSPYFLL